MATRKTKLDPAIQHIPLDRLRVFQVSEGELDSLEKGSAESVLLNFAIGVLSIAVSLSASLATATFPNDRAFYVVVIITVVGYVSGAVLALLWLTARRSLKGVATRIRSRVPPEGEQANPDEPS